jgi:hypothetical protein
VVFAISCVGMLVQTSPAQAAGVCLVQAQNVHLSKHSGYTRLNSIGSVSCTYDPIGPLLLEVRMRKLVGGSWTTVSTTPSILNDTTTYVRHSRSRGCSTGTYRTESRAYASGPLGQPPVWSYWAVGYTTNVTNCNAPGPVGADI